MSSRLSAGPRHGTSRIKISPRTPHRLHQMIAYRAETAMTQIVRQMMSRHDDARGLLRAAYSSEVDVIPINKPSPDRSPSTPRQRPTRGSNIYAPGSTPPRHNSRYCIYPRIGLVGFGAKLETS
jgi:hypothetical protein